MLYLIFGAAVAVGAGVTFWLHTRPLDQGTVSDAWRAEQRGKKELEP